MKKKHDKLKLFPMVHTSPRAWIGTASLFHSIQESIGRMVVTMHSLWTVN